MFIFEFLLAMIMPWLFILDTLRYIPGTILSIIKKSQYSTFTSPDAFKYAWFAEFWKGAGQGIKENAEPRARPLIEQAHGVIIDVGPGSGEWISLFDKSKVTKIYGIEPNKDHHAGLRKRIIEAGLSDIYVLVPVGVENISEHVLNTSNGGAERVKKGEVDCIMTIQCLCSVPSPKAMIDELYTYLKPGGEWYVYEHVVAKAHKPIVLYQAFLGVLWPHFMGGCEMTRDTGKWLKEAGSWSKVDLKAPSDEPSYHVLPHVMGVLMK